MRTKFLSMLAVAAAALASAQHATAQNSSPYWSLAGNSNASATSKLGTTNNNPLRLFTNNGERVRITPAGKVGIGTTSPVGKLTVKNNGGTPSSDWVLSGDPVFTTFAEATGGNADHILAMASNTSTARPNIIVRRSRGTLSNPNAVVNNDFLSSLQASGHDGTNFQNPANVDFFVDGTPSAGNVPARISFSTGTNLGNRTERLTIKASGNVGIGTTSPSNKLHVVGRGRFTDGLSVESGGIYSSYSSGNGVEGYGNTSYGIGTYGSGYYGAYGSGAKYGAYGYSSTGFGVYGLSTSSYNANGSTGVYGTAYYGVQGKGTYGVFGEGSSYGLYGSSASNYGVVGVGAYGVYGSGTSYGIYGYSSKETGVYGYTGGGGTNYYGVYGYNGSTGYGVRGYCYSGAGVYGSSNSGYAGYFAGNVYATGTYQGSDRKLKKNIEDLSSAMDIINKLQPRSYEYRQDGNYKLMHLPTGKRYGLIAQELEEVLPNLVKVSSFDTRMEDGVKPIDSKNVDAKKETVQSETIEFKAVNYTELIPILVKGMQEQQKEIETLKAEVSRLRQNNGNVTSVTGAGSLGQATPNPVRGNTRISYSLPQGAVRGQLLLTDAAGKALKAVTLTTSGVIDLNTASLPSGTYNYTLMADGKLLDTKKLTVVR